MIVEVHLNTVIDAAVIVAILTAVWRMSALTSRLEHMSKAAVENLQKVDKRIEQLEKKLERLDLIPVHEQRIGALEAAKVEIVRRLEVVWDKLFSTRIQAVRASLASRPDLEDQ